MSGERYKLEDAKSEGLRAISLIDAMLDRLCDHGGTDRSGAIQVLLDNAVGHFRTALSTLEELSSVEAKAQSTSSH